MLSFGGAGKPGEENSNARGVPRKVSAHLCGPVSWEKKMVSRAKAATKNDGFVRWERGMTKGVEGGGFV